MRKYLYILIVVLLIGGIYSSLSQSKTEKKSVALETIRIGTFSRGVSYGPYFVAREKGLFDQVASKYHAKLEFTEFQTLPAVNEALASNRVDMIFEAEVPASIGKAAGIDVKISGVSDIYKMEMLLPINSDITSISQLKNKKIAAQSGTSGFYVVSRILAKNNIPLTSVQLIDMTAADAKVAFETGQVDAWAIWPPFVQQEQIDGKGKLLPEANGEVQSIYGFRGAFLQANPEVSKDLVGVIKDAQTWIKNNNAQAREIIAKQLNTKQEVVDLAWPKHNFQPNFSETQFTDIQSKADFFYQIGMVKNKIDARKDLIKPID